MAGAGAASEGAKTIVIKLGTSSILNEATLQPKIGTLSAIVDRSAEFIAEERAYHALPAELALTEILLVYRDEPAEYLFEVPGRFQRTSPRSWGRAAAQLATTGRWLASPCP